MRSNRSVRVEAPAAGFQLLRFEGVFALPDLMRAPRQSADAGAGGSGDDAGHPDGCGDVLGEVGVGRDLQAVLAALGTPDLRRLWIESGPCAGLTGGQRVWAEADLAVSVAQGWDRQHAWVTAQREAALAAAAAAVEAAPPPEGLSARAAARWSGREVAHAELAAALRISPRGVGAAIDRAVRLTMCATGTRDLLAHGWVSPAHARALLDETAVLGDPTPPTAGSTADDSAAVARAARVAEMLTAVEARVLPRALGQTAAQFRAAVRRAVLAVDPQGAADRHESARAQRSVTRAPAEDSMSVLTAVLTAPEVQVVYAALDAVIAAMTPSPSDSTPSDSTPSDSTPGDANAGDATPGRTPVAELRADALVAICAAILGDPTAAPSSLRATPQEPAIRVTIGADTLLGVDDEPGDLHGHGPIPAALARELAADGTWRRLVTDPLTGELLDRSPHTYTASARLRAFITARDRTCRHPGCPTSAASADLDHTQPFDHDDPAAGGPTTRANLCARCRRHHNLKTWYGFTAHHDPDGTLITRTPLGRTYRTAPPRQPTTE